MPKLHLSMLPNGKSSEADLRPTEALDELVSSEYVECNLPLGVNKHETYTETREPAPAIPDPAAELERQIALLNRDPTKPVTGSGGTVHIGIDSEWQYNPVTGRNEIICYTACVVRGDKSCNYIYCTRGAADSCRLNLGNFLSQALKAAQTAGVIAEMPGTIIMCAHFLRADIAHFSDFFSEYSHKVDGLRRSVSTLTGSVEVNLEEADVDDGRHFRGGRLIITDTARAMYSCAVRFVDTMLLTPTGMGLKEAGLLLGLEKLELPAGYDKAQMAQFFAERPAEAEEYAIRDAEITVRYYLKVAEIAASELGLRSVPLTMGSMAVTVFKKGLKDEGRDVGGIFGTSDESVVYWNARNQRPARVRRTSTAADRRIFEQLAKDCYHGGRNECFHVGPTDSAIWYDFDLPGAYTNALVELQELDYAAAYIERDPLAFCGGHFGLARVQFAFPPGTRFPSLPVRTAEHGIYFPLCGVTYCTAPEIEVALGLGAEIRVLQGVVIPWVTDSKSIFEPFVRLVRTQRQRHAKGSLEERLWKEIGNSLYGKLAQGLREKSVFDTRTRRGREVPPSPITNPYFAAYATGFVRAVLGEIIARVPPHRRVLSVTTDGFLTDASQDELDLSGPLCRRFAALLERVQGGVTMLECKHKARQLVCMRTRGQVTAVGHDGSPPILAKAGVKPPLPKTEHNSYMLDLYLRREPGQKHDSSHLVSTREMWLTHSDMVEVKRSVKLSLEFDFKRRPINPRMVDVSGISHIALDTVPWSGKEEGELARAIFDGWRATHVLKTLNDFEDWEDYYAGRIMTRGKGIKMTAEGAVGIARRVYLRAYARGAWGIKPNRTYAETAGWLTVNGYPTQTDDLKNAKRTKPVEGIVPVTPRVMALMKLLIADQAGLDLGKFFGPRAEKAVAALEHAQDLGP